MLSGKNIALGVTGGIAAYKAADLASRLKKAGADVRVVMTRSACQFVAPLTFESLTGHRVERDLFERPWEMGHISLAKFADVFVVAPATANLIGKYAGGIADDLLSTALLAAPCPVLLAPAMNGNMWKNAAVQENVAALKRRGVAMIGPGRGHLACGDEDVGRMEEPATILDAIDALADGRRDFAGLKVLVTAGPTREFADPVRYVSNRSTGKMGYAIARAARNRGAAVTLLSGPVELAPPVGVEVVNITTTRDLYEAALRRAPEADVVIQAAAPADFRPAQYAQSKIKKSGEGMRLDLAANPDVARALGEATREGQILVAFAAETNDLRENARGKLLRKNADLIVANDVTVPGAGFGTDTNCALLITRAGETEVPLCAKGELAERILDCVKELRHG